MKIFLNYNHKNNNINFNKINKYHKKMFKNVFKESLNLKQNFKKPKIHILNKTLIKNNKFFSINKNMNP
jgi:hypothetical protein